MRAKFSSFRLLPLLPVKLIYPGYQWPDKQGKKNNHGLLDLPCGGQKGRGIKKVEVILNQL